MPSKPGIVSWRVLRALTERSLSGGYNTLATHCLTTAAPVRLIMQGKRRSPSRAFGISRTTYTGGLIVQPATGWQR